MADEDKARISIILAGKTLDLSAERFILVYSPEIKGEIDGRVIHNVSPEEAFFLLKFAEANIVTTPMVVSIIRGIVEAERAKVTKGPEPPPGSVTHT